MPTEAKLELLGEGVNEGVGDGLGDTLPLAFSPPETTTLIDSYRLVRPLGRGGMGEVWLAEQISPVERQVALKLIRGGLDAEGFVVRFKSERQAIALMQHPAIAQVFDAGSTSDGLPYFVMEYVDGTPITEFCDANRLPTDERLQLFIQVCEGVQHAHQKAIIHRDLKPSNVLVTMVDGKPQPKIIDFGIAKAVGLRLTAESVVTEVGALVGTPEYMSPEQADPASGGVDTRTDVYSLGVILYQLVTGALPLGARDLRSISHGELKRLIRDEEPPKPSSMIGSLGESGIALADYRRTDPVALSRQLQGDLDAITLKALEKDRDRRYGTPSELSADIERYLRHEPVVARPASRSYRLQKYVRRHRIGVALGSTFLFLLATFAFISFLQARRIARERDRANIEANSSRAVTDFLVRLFRVSNPSEARGKEITARELLDKAVMDLDRLSSEPRLQARLLGTMGEVYSNLYQLQRAEEILGRAKTLADVALGPDDPDTFNIRMRLATTKIYLGQYREAEIALRALIQDGEIKLDRRDRLLGKARNVLVNCLVEASRFAEAEQLAKQVLATQLGLFGPDDELVLNVMASLGSIYEQLQRFDDAESWLRKTQASQVRVLGPDHPNTIFTTESVGIVLMKSGKLDEAERWLKDALERSTRVFGADNMNPLAIASNLAQTYARQGRFELANRTAQGILETKRRVLGPDNPRTVLAEIQLGYFFALQHEYSNAAKAFEEAAAHAHRVLPAGHSSRADPLLIWASMEFEQGNRESAYNHIGQALHESGEYTREMLSNDPEWSAFRGDAQMKQLIAESLVQNRK